MGRGWTLRRGLGKCIFKTSAQAVVSDIIRRMHTPLLVTPPYESIV